MLCACETQKRKPASRLGPRRTGGEEKRDWVVLGLFWFAWTRERNTCLEAGERKPGERQQEEVGLHSLPRDLISPTAKRVQAEVKAGTEGAPVDVAVNHARGDWDQQSNE